MKGNRKRGREESANRIRGKNKMKEVTEWTNGAKGKERGRKTEEPREENRWIDVQIDRLVPGSSLGISKSLDVFSSEQ